VPPPVKQCVPPCTPPAFCLNGRCAA
jgi:hypothetical protein